MRFIEEKHILLTENYEIICQQLLYIVREKNQIVIYCIQKNLSYQLWNRTPALANRATISAEAGSEMAFARNNYPSTAEGI